MIIRVKLLKNMNKHPKYKMALLVWIAIYPTINLLFYFLGDYLVQLHMLLRTLLLTAILVPLMVFILLPFLTKIFRNWLIK